MTITASYNLLKASEWSQHSDSVRQFREVLLPNGSFVQAYRYKGQAFVDGWTINHYTDINANELVETEFWGAHSYTGLTSIVEARKIADRWAAHSGGYKTNFEAQETDESAPELFEVTIVHPVGSFPIHHFHTTPDLLASELLGWIDENIRQERWAARRVEVSHNRLYVGKFFIGSSSDYYHLRDQVRRLFSKVGKELV